MLLRSSRRRPARHDHPDREAVEQAIDFLTKVGKARLVTETLGL
jgi:hypothetical protein